MPVSVALPGYRPATGGAVADILGAINSMQTGASTRALQAKQAEAAGLANQQTQMQTDAAKLQMQQMNAPDSSATRMTKAEGLMMLKNIGNSGLASDQDSQTQIKGLSDVINDPGTTGMQVNSYFSNSPMVKSFQELQKAKLTGGAAASRAETMKANSQEQANKQYSDQFGSMEGTISSANKVHNIISKIKGGGLKSTPTLSQDLAKGLDQMFGQGGNTVAGTEHAREGLASLEGDLAKKIGYGRGKSMNTVPIDMLDQLDRDVMAARDEFKDIRSNQFNAWINGMAQQHQPALMKRFSAFSNSSTKGSFQAQQPKDEGGLSRADKIKHMMQMDAQAGGR